MEVDENIFITLIKVQVRKFLKKFGFLNILNKGNFALGKAVNMKVVTGKGAMKPADLFISTAISFKSAYLCCYYYNRRT